ncbi:MAG: sigma 54-interacting transcriptional regulator [Calditrichia bacterium]
MPQSRLWRSTVVHCRQICWKASCLYLPKGAFTGAIRDKKGLFEVANGGTLFLDEIANMPLEVQSKFLRAIQESEIRPLGSTNQKSGCADYFRRQQRVE